MLFELLASIVAIDLRLGLLTFNFLHHLLPVPALWFGFDKDQEHQATGQSKRRQRIEYHVPGMPRIVNMMIEDRPYHHGHNETGGHCQRIADAKDSAREATGEIGHDRRLATGLYSIDERHTGHQQQEVSAIASGERDEHQLSAGAERCHRLEQLAYGGATEWTRPDQ